MKRIISKSPLIAIISSLLISTPYQVYASENPTHCDSEIASLTPPHRDISREETLELKIREGLKKCITNFSPQSTPWYAFTDALRELEEYGHVLSPFTSDALENYEINYPENICFNTNRHIIELVEIIYNDEI